jgi:tetratricopeptide (TPR) repeat protein
LIKRRLLAAVLVLPILAASHVRAQTAAADLLAKGKADWFAMRTKSAEQKLIAAARTPATAAEAHFWLGRIYDFKGNKAEGAFPGFHEEVSYRPRAEAEFQSAGAPNPRWIAEGEAFENALKAADAAVAKAQSSTAPIAELRASIEKRVAVRPDPMSYVAGANALLARNGDLPFVLRLAADGRVVGDRFIWENESSYKLDGKVRASLDRNAAVFADIAGWALYLQGDLQTAEQRLAEAARLYRNVDATNQLHLAELSRKKSDLENAREHYLTALGLAGITPPQRDQAKAALADVQAKNGENPADFERWLAATLDRKREERRRALVSNMTGRKLPALVLKDLQGNNVDLRAERGNVVLLNFFSAW